MEWVEIIEPRTKEHMYANLTTGECVWDPPSGVNVKKTDDNQWWELFDQNTQRFYYYNAVSQNTVWHRPSNCDIIPLAKLQTLKHNTEPPPDDEGEDSKPKESVATQTPGKCVRPPKPTGDIPRLPHKAVSCETQTSPNQSPRIGRRSHHHTHSHGSHHSHRHHNVQPSSSATSQSKVGQKINNSQESSRSSDSSSRTSLDNHRVAESPHHRHHGGLPTSTSTPLLDKKPLKELNLPPLRGNTEGGKTTTTSHSIIGKPDTNLSVAKQRSFDVETSLGIGGCYSNYGHENPRTTRAKQTLTAPAKTPTKTPTPIPAKDTYMPDIARSCSFVQRRNTFQDEEDSMHEKYFMSDKMGMRSVEGTPQARRKQSSSHGSKSSREDSQSTTPAHSRKSHGSGHKSSSASAGHHEYRPSHDSRYNKPAESESESESSSPITTSPSSPISLSRGNKRNNYPSLDSHAAHRHSSHSEEAKSLKESERRGTIGSKDGGSSGGGGGDTFRRQHARDLPDSRHKYNYNDVRSSMRTEHKEKQDYRQMSMDTKENRDIYRENGSPNYAQHIKFYSMERGYDRMNATPLYSNTMDYPYNDSNLLPLHKYILEQAKLSGCYKFGDPFNDEMDSLHSEDETSGGRPEYDSDEFADDEGMSNQGDSSSQEYLEDPVYCEDDKYRLPPVEYKNSVDYIESLESRMAVNTAPQGVYYSGVPSGGFPPRPPGPHVQHASLKRKKDLQPSPNPIANLYSPIVEKTENAHRPNSLPSSQGVPYDVVDRPESPRSALTQDKKLPSESDIEKYAQGHLNIHKKGIFRKKFTVRDMLSWSKDPIRKPMLVLAEKGLKKDACELFKLVQIYMTDRKAKAGMTLGSVALDICSTAYNKPLLRDELYVQICRQTTENPRRESLRRGWELMAICLNFFPPTAKFQGILEGYMNRHRDPGFDFPEVVKWPIHVQISHYATVSCKRLERIGVNGKKPPRKPTVEEIDQARLQIFRASMFGNTLEEVMHLQKERFPDRRLPWVQTILSEEVLRLQGTQTEGIFRVSADVDEVNCLKNKIDHWEVPTETMDAHAPASLLKLWYRELYEPLIPDNLYSECVTHHDDPDVVLAIVHRLPSLNKLVLCYLVRFLQVFSRADVAQITKMDASNLAMVMAPNCLRCTSTDPRVIFDNARKEMSFMRTLIQCLDTTFMEGIC